MNPRDVVPESNMPAFAFLANVKAKDTVGADIEKKMEVMRGLPMRVVFRPIPMRKSRVPRLRLVTRPNWMF
jgi:hypothetical protein